MQDEVRRRKTDAYIAEHVRIVARAIYSISGGELRTPSFEEFMTQKQVTDTRTAQEIKQDILRKLVS